MPPKSNPPLRPGLCTVCNHPAKEEIDNAIIKGESLRPLAALYGLSPSALSRHHKHIRRAIAAELKQDQFRLIAATLDDLDLIRTRLDRLYKKSEDAHSLHVSLGCLQESLKLLTLRAKLRHALDAIY